MLSIAYNGNTPLSEYLRRCIEIMQKAKDFQDILNVIMRPAMTVSFPDVVTAYMIFLFFFVTVASNECSFSKLKLLKTYLRAAGNSEYRTIGLQIF